MQSESPNVGDIFIWTSVKRPFNDDAFGICLVLGKSSCNQGVDVFDITSNDHDHFGFGDFDSSKKQNSWIKIDYIFRCNESLDMIK